jgi:hypothetical protein
MSAGKPFEAGKYLSNVNGRDYLEVKWRLLWLRTEHPEATVETELVKHEGDLALFRARVAIPDGGAATGWGSETAGDFGDYIEKAETKALGRALAALGYGTQFCEDFDFSAQTSVRSKRAAAAASGRPQRAANPPAEHPEAAPRVVDSPVGRSDLRVVRDAHPEPATRSQVKAIYAIGRDLPHVGDGDIEERSRSRFGKLPAELTKRQASEFIDILRRPAVAGLLAAPAN